MRTMDENRNEDGLFNAHTGAAFGLIAGIVLGSLLLNVPGVAAARGLPDQLRSAMQTVVGNIVQAPVRAGS